MAPLASTVVESPLGRLKLVASTAGLVAILWEHEDPDRIRLGPLAEAPAHPVLAEAARQLAAYFAGTLRSFTVPLDLRGTPFQQSVWAALLAIPFGETRTYSQVARHLGRPAASRAVGAANGRNPVAIITPCHRLVGSDGKLTGFAGGLAAKRFLLDLEQAGRAATAAGHGSTEPPASTA